MTLFSRNGNVFRYPAVADAVRKLPAKSAVIDGEIVAVDKEGRPCFEALGKSGTLQAGCVIQFYAFDLLHVNGRDSMTWLIEKRKDLLASVSVSARTMHSSHFLAAA